MPRRKSTEIRVFGPYKHGDKHRLQRRGPGDLRAWISFDTKEKALEAKRATERKLSTHRTIGEAVKEYLEELGQRKKRDWKTVEAVRNFLLQLFPRQEISLSEMGPRHYRRMVDGGRYADATHRRALGAGKALCAWAVKRGYLRQNPLGEVEPEGEANTGKEALTVDEARAWYAVAYRRAAEGSDAALALLGCLLLGMRPTEAAQGSLVRDLDASGTMLHVTGKGRKKPRRTYRLTRPALAPYRALLAAAARGRAGELPLLAGPRGGPLTRNALWEEMRRVCTVAKVRPVCPHSLRTTHSGIRLEAGEEVGTVAESIGNSAPILRRHYGGEAAAANGRSGAVAELVTVSPESVPGEEVPVAEQVATTR